MGFARMPGRVRDLWRDPLRHDGISGEIHYGMFGVWCNVEVGVLDPTDEKIVESPESPPVVQKPRYCIWPLVLFVLATLCCDFLLLPLENNVATMNLGGWQFPATVINLPFIEMILPGMMIGQAAFACVLGGLWGRYWLQGVVAASAYCCLAMGLFFVSEKWQNQISFGEGDMQWGLFAIPVVVLAMSSPLLLLRYARGWRLAREGDRWTQPTMEIEGLFLMTASVACLVFVARIPPIAWESSLAAHYLQMSIICGLLSAVCLLAVVPSVLVAFRIRHWAARVLLLSIIPTVLVVLVMTAFSAILNLAQPESVGPTWTENLGLSVVAGFMFAVGVSTIIACGYRLTSSPKTRLAIDEGELRQQAIAARTTARRWVGAVFALSILSSICVARLQAWRTTADVRNAELHRSIVAQGGELSVRGRDVITLRLGPTATDNSILDFRHLSKLETISFAGTAITDDVLDNLGGFPALNSLDLSNTQLTDQGLQKLRRFNRLEHLSLAGTNITREGLRDFLESCNIASLDLSNLDLQDADVEYLAVLPVQTLKIRDNHLTDAGLQRLLERASWTELDVSGNEIHGVGLDASSNYVGSLTLEDIPLSDVEFLAAIKKLDSLGALRLARTQLSDAILPKLFASGIRNLEFGEGFITEAGLTTATNASSFERLALSAPQFTGACFETWQPAIQNLDMSASGINDETVKYLRSLSLISLDLSNTAIGDASLPDLAKLSVYEIDLSHTRITARGLMENPLSEIAVIKIAIGQFTDEEVHALRRVILQLTVGTERLDF